MSEQQSAAQKFLALLLLSFNFDFTIKVKERNISKSSVYGVIHTEARTIAKEFGDMRQSIITELTNQVDAQWNSGILTLELNNNIISRLDPKTKYHTIGHTSFNPSFAGGYDRPSTAGTFPINLKKLMKGIERGIKRL